MRVVGKPFIACQRDIFRRTAHFSSEPYTTTGDESPYYKRVYKNFTHSSTLGDVPLVELIVEHGAEAIDRLPEGIRTNEAAIAATIENNLRRLIVDKSDVNPRYYEEISRLLDDIIRQRRQEAIDYHQYLSEIEGLSGRITEHENEGRYSSNMNTNPLRAFFDNLNDLPEDQREAAALAIDTTIRETKQDDWRNNRFKKIQVRNAIALVIQEEFGDYNLDANALFELAVNQSEY